jgi:protein-L-isoaspartate(D-aspartate) O-methyltransferase
LMWLKVAIFLSVMLLLAPGAGKAEGVDWTRLRNAMVDEQIIARGVRDERVLAAMRKIERHLFVSPDLQSRAYEDHPLPIGEGQTISQPYIVAYMTEAAGVKKGSKVLEIGTGSGYQAAVLSEMGAEVYSIEIIATLNASAQERLRALGYRDIQFRLGDGYQGWPEEAPFDVIIVTAAPPEVPMELFRELKEGGRMVIPVGEGFQSLQVVTKERGQMKVTNKIPVAFVPMVRGKEQKIPLSPGPLHQAKPGGADGN